MATEPEIEHAYRSGFSDGAYAEWASAMVEVRGKLDGLPPEVAAVLRAALDALGLTDLADVESGPLHQGDTTEAGEAFEAWRKAEAEAEAP